MKRSILALCALAAFAPASISAHCQVPCGIYDDNNVIAKMHTDYVTIEKASQQIIELSKDPAKNAHQLTRWIMNKESHAQAIQTTVTDYFLAQRLKPEEAESNQQSYLKKLTTCHKVIVAAMKCKQSTDAKAVTDLHNHLHAFEALFGTK
ncbi:superoxide dismutase, Ni [Akkermansiaceae bacterium]|nr:superoxide dismutase, Ni [Akkermansiaceae bacterium]